MRKGTIQLQANLQQGNTLSDGENQHSKSAAQITRHQSTGEKPRETLEPYGCPGPGWCLQVLAGEGVLRETDEF